MSEQKTVNISYDDAIEQVMLNNGYFAPLKLIYSEIWKYKDKNTVAGKTPNNTIQERVQRNPKFTKIGLGIYALTEKINLLEEIKEPKTKTEKIATRHSEIQGMLLEIGNSRSEVQETYTNDKKALFQNKKLGNLATLKSLPLFTYEKIIKESASFIDVLWFNERNFPSHAFEVECSTDFRDAFIKFMELQDFLLRFICVSPAERKIKYDREIDKSAFSPIRGRVEFFSYEKIESEYETSLKKSFI